MWSQLSMMVVGIWVTAAPGVFDFEKSIATNGHVVGPLIATFGIVAAAEATRNVRWASLPFGAWLLVAPWILGYDNVTAMISDLIAGAATVLLCYVRPRRDYTFGGGWPAFWKTNTMHWRASGNKSVQH
jgi:hypothetical protein